MNWIRSVWKRLVTSRYVEALEIEVTRLRIENRALMNSILGIAGVPPVITSEGSGQGSATAAASSATASKVAATVQAASAVRRPSWHQVNRTLEFESAKKKEPGTAKS